MKGLYIMRENSFESVYPIYIRNEIESVVDIIEKPLTIEEIEKDPSILGEVDVIFSGWGGLQFTKEYLNLAPRLKAVFHAAGSIKSIVTDEFWEREIIITTANFANAIPVAEFTLAQIILALKNTWRIVFDIKQTKEYPARPINHISGGFGSIVGLISLSTIGKEVNKYLQDFNVKVIAYDPFVMKEEADLLNIELCSLSEIFKRSNVVSLHSPLLPETVGMITGAHFEQMKKNATFINTARGAIVKEEEMVDVLQIREDITAIIDVTHPEPPVKGSLLYDLPNVMLTPHIAGSQGRECGRMGSFMLSELKRFMKGEQLKWSVNKKEYEFMA